MKVIVYLMELIVLHQLHHVLILQEQMILNVLHLENFVNIHYQVVVHNNVYQKHVKIKQELI